MSTEPIEAVVDAAAEQPAPLPEPGQPMIEVRGLWSAFPRPGGGQVVVHKDLDLTVYRGEVLTLVGGSGTGKTVLLRQMLGLNTPYRGTVTVLGQPVRALADRRGNSLHSSSTASTTRSDCTLAASRRGRMTSVISSRAMAQASLRLD